MEDKLIMKVNNGIVAIIGTIGMIAIFIWIWIEGNMREKTADYRVPSMTEKIIMILLVVACIYMMVIFMMVLLGRKLELTKAGCTVSLLFIKKFYPWEEYQVKRLERYHENKRGMKYMVVYDEGVVFSRRPLKIIEMKKCGEFRLGWRHRGFSTVWFCFQTEESKKKGRDYYTVYDIDKDLFFRKMEEWGIELDLEVDEWIG